MKYIIILLAISNIVIGEVCERQVFEEIFTSDTHFTGNFNYDAPLEKNLPKRSINFKIIDIQEGKISFNQDDTEYTKFFW
jgi:hypothetical protein